MTIVGYQDDEQLMNVEATVCIDIGPAPGIFLIKPIGCVCAGDISDDELRRMGAEWTRRLLALAAKQREEAASRVRITEEPKP